MDHNKSEFAGLSARQWEVLSRIYTGESTNIYPQPTVNALLKRGLIVKVEETMKDAAGRFPIRMFRYAYPTLGHHMAWCFECSRREK